MTIKKKVLEISFEEQREKILGKEGQMGERQAAQNEKHRKPVQMEGGGGCVRQVASVAHYQE